jgi:hypothetical protein
VPAQLAYVDQRNQVVSAREIRPLWDAGNIVPRSEQVKAKKIPEPPEPSRDFGVSVWIERMREVGKRRHWLPE